MIVAGEASPMAETWLRYDRMVEDALRSVVRKALIEDRPSLGAK